jgi:outer membrane protein TolC
VGLNLQIPLFDGGLTQARSQQAREIVEQLQALYEGSRRNALLEINGLQLELRNRFQRLEVAQRNLDSAQEAARIARLRYQNGLSTNVELLDSEAALTAAQNDTVASRYQYLQSLARYQRAAALEEGSP